MMASASTMSDAIFAVLALAIDADPPEAAKLLPGRIANGSAALFSGDLCCEREDTAARPKNTGSTTTRLKMRIKSGLDARFPVAVPKKYDRRENDGPHDPADLIQFKFRSFIHVKGSNFQPKTLRQSF